jgi:hypothetical protein
MSQQRAIGKARDLSGYNRRDRKIEKRSYLVGYGFGNSTQLSQWGEGAYYPCPW